ncbi:MAG: type II toxin-antitoxin system RelE/ParE family toxin [bacterium]
MAGLIWGEGAILDLEGIYDYIARDSYQYAKHQIKRIYRSVEHLQHFPESGRHVPEFPHLPHREIIVDNFRVIYRYDAESDIVLIVTVVHVRRLLRKDVLT